MIDKLSKLFFPIDVDIMLMPGIIKAMAMPIKVIWALFLSIDVGALNELKTREAIKNK